MSDWFNYIAALKILAVGLLIGAGLPALFAIGVRLNAEGAGATEHAASQRHPLITALSWVIFALVVVAAVVGVLFIARDFIAHQTGLYLLGAQPT
ncbi:hypothetical protein H7I53_20980 [Mycolicibacterium pulveris]|uniref:Transmembrane protein n=1 Tax=Mycolicibacterium pulveris TaxID=36813 RepID=A0A7I7UFY1_MYCPV|nr:hypothetical protein [Mycolicibacterium pulveris]MCV6982687.1 hypothetical protein [Mycolicibacterium pulveris]BBY80384.1 hypothetical protein MPUL_15420 [Mycolicibacterium pulveris]